jgi:ABC-type phosphate transport system auxiliary subunit
MKICICMGFILLLAAPLHAETYSWVDDSGTYNFTEDYSSVPKKYRKKVKRREDIQQNVKPQASVVPESPTRQADKTVVKSAPVQGDGKDMYGGKSRADWHKEMQVLEAELRGLDQHIEKVKAQITDANGVSNAQLEVLKKDYVDSRATYDQKYKSYTELVETIRKTGIAVEIKK